MINFMAKNVSTEAFNVWSGKTLIGVLTNILEVGTIMKSSPRTERTIGWEGVADAHNYDEDGIYTRFLIDDGGEELKRCGIGTVILSDSIGHKVEYGVRESIVPGFPGFPGLEGGGLPKSRRIQEVYLHDLNLDRKYVGLGKRG
tara:strand:- start:403 stop:834 length:432 start_codon:yes stop_codon:yes gene_type:complete